ncbi:hypothetical protein CASFOL_031612 [Castilleja foliolosa]|uniref:NADH:ubiquinone reductase (non-electrogenic) n=1 Tax=Castilleja foliolosa TaxID=1961234 RepID=A0ABD3C5T3_9LAMI
MTVFQRFSRTFRENPSLVKIMIVFTVSSGGLVAFSEANSDSGVNIVNPIEAEGKKKRVVVLGTGWAGTSFLKNLKSPSYDVQVISPRNFFAFTPLLPSVTCGTVEPRSIVEPIRNIVRKKNLGIHYWEAECFRIDPENKKVYCRSNLSSDANEKEEIVVDYDYLVVSIGARSNTFNIPGVAENCHFLKEIEDAQKIRRTIVDCFERASLPNLSDEERKKILHFVVVGGGPTGVEFAAELHDYVNEDLVKLYPKAKEAVKITLLEATDHILNMFDKRITAFAEEKFKRDGIDVKTGAMVLNVSDKEISTKELKNGGAISSMPYGMVVWSTGIGTRPVIMDFMKQIGQGNRRVLATDEWMRVEGSDSIYALGDCATINQRKVMEDVWAIFGKADKDNSGTLTVKEFQEVLNDICERYPQVGLYLKSRQMKGLVDLLKDSKGDAVKESVEVNLEEFKSAMSQVDSQMKNLPATAQVAAQQGSYLADCFNRMEECEKNPEGPLRFRGEGRHRFHPFSVQAFWTICSIGRRANCCPASWRLGFDWTQHSVALVFCVCQQASKLAYKGVGDIRLGEAFHLWKGLEWNLTRQDLQFSFGPENDTRFVGSLRTRNFAAGYSTQAKSPQMTKNGRPGKRWPGKEKKPSPLFPVDNPSMADKRPEIERLLGDQAIKKILENEWLLMELLVRLPAENLTRYKLVCKDWRDLIESPNFVSAHLNHSKRNPSRHHILFKGDTFRPFKSAIRFYSPYVIIVGSINGLICFAGKGTTKYVESPDDIWILNPITGNAIDLPFPDSPVDVTGFDSVTLAFWCDSVTGGYKVVKITSKCDPDSKTYSISSRPVVSNSVELWDSSYPDIWTTIPMGFDRPFHHARAYGWVTRCDAVIGMHCYWIMSYSKGLGAFVLSLNMKTLVLEQIALPDISIPDKTLHEYLADDYKANFFGANWNGNFALVGKGKSCAGIHYYNVWILDVCGVWSEKFCFHLDFRIHRFINCIDETLVLQRVAGDLVFYNTVNRKCFLLGKKGFYERETPSEGDMAIVDHELFNIWLKLVAAGCSDSAEDYPCSFNDFQISFQDMDIRNSDDEIDNDLAHTFAESVDDFVGSLLTIDKFEPFIPEDQEFMFIRPSVLEIRIQIRMMNKWKWNKGKRSKIVDLTRIIGRLR